MTPGSSKHRWSTFRAVLAYAQHHKAITANPVDGVDLSGGSAKCRDSRHHPLTAEQVAAVADLLAPVFTEQATFDGESVASFCTFGSTAARHVFPFGAIPSQPRPVAGVVAMSRDIADVSEGGLARLRHGS